MNIPKFSAKKRRERSVHAMHRSAAEISELSNVRSGARKREIRHFSSEHIKPVKTRHEQLEFLELSDTVKRSVRVIRFFRRSKKNV